MPTTTLRAGSAPPNLEQLQPTCGVTSTSTNSDNTLLAQVECDTRLATCPPGATYPPQTGVHLAPLPADLPTMTNPCSGVPTNAWCSASSSAGSSLGTSRRDGGGAQGPDPVLFASGLLAAGCPTDAHGTELHRQPFRPRGGANTSTLRACCGGRCGTRTHDLSRVNPFRYVERHDDRQRLTA